MGDKREGSGYLCHALMINHHVSCSPLSQTSILPLIYSQAGKSTEGVVRDHCMISHVSSA